MLRACGRSLTDRVLSDYSASLGSEEESGKDWDELEEEARKGWLCAGKWALVLEPNQSMFAFLFANVWRSLKQRRRMKMTCAVFTPNAIHWANFCFDTQQIRQIMRS